MATNIFSAAEALDRKRKTSPEELMRLLDEAKTAIEQLPELQKVVEEKESREKLEKTISDNMASHESMMKAERQKMSEMKSTLDSEIANLKTQVKVLEAKARDSSKLQERLNKEHEMRLLAEANLKASMNVPRETPQKIDFSEDSVARKVSSMIPKPKRGKWNFEIVRDGDGHISRVVARPD